MNLKGYLNSLKLLINHITKLFLIIILLQSFASAQQETAKSDTTINADSSAFVMHKSPLGAVLRSAVLPGWGQIYNESYIKAPIVWGIFASLAAGWIFYNNKYVSSRDAYIQTQIEGYRLNRDFYRDQRDLMSIYIGLAYLLNLVDAYVDAQLFDFNVQPNPTTGQNMLNMRFKF